MNINVQLNEDLKIKISRKDHNTLFPYDKIKCNRYCEYYLDANILIIHRFNSCLIKSFVLAYPLIILLYGILNWKETHEELMREVFKRNMDLMYLLFMTYYETKN